jgi:hypothetical protein
MKEGDGPKTAKRRTRIWSAEAERRVTKGVLVLNKGPPTVWNDRSVASGQPKQRWEGAQNGKGKHKRIKERNDCARVLGWFSHKKEGVCQK